MVVTTPVKDNYMLSRGFGANSRINLQYYLWKDGSDYIIHPSISIDGENLRVADIGSGTCIWLIEMSRRLKPSAQLDGLDVCHDQSPPTELLPSNISLRIHDCLSEPPADLLGVYDIIHIQNFNSVIRDNDPVPVVKNMLKMLKAEGHLTWGEYDFQTWKSATISSGTGYDDELPKLLEYNATFGHTQKPNFQIHNWTANLPETFSECGVVDVVVERRSFSPEISTFLLDTFMVASWEISKNVLDPLGGERGNIARKYIETVG
ncbi:hypothetical protein CC78DRAFT_571122 [Lojkania enalia]|uniref:Methyltransferase domain-containing protein n=1 Tax=Lojkania enalia TaxID=147567 RepID=A0A9P4N3B7_9PLEO|nr:hypothetical protein CC78DRAFT_571122 [Didymosphaeria enalia]